MRLLTTWLIVDSAKAVEIGSPCPYRSPLFGMNARLAAMYPENCRRAFSNFRVHSLPGGNRWEGRGLARYSVGVVRKNFGRHPIVP